LKLNKKASGEMEDSAQVLEYLRGRQTLLDRVIAEAGRDYIRSIWTRPNTRFDLATTNEELFRLSKGGDFCYDRPSSGLLYALWYHGRRVNTSLALVLNLVRQAQGQAVKILDLGAGVGAVQWALAIACETLEAEGKQPPHFEMISVDTSPFMLFYLKHQWRYLSAKIPACRNVDYQAQLNTWHALSGKSENLWLFASYLFDHEDKKASLAQDFNRLVTDLHPQQVILSTSRQPRKVAFLDAIGRQLATGDFVPYDGTYMQPFDRDLAEVNRLRSDLKKVIPSIQGMSTWRDYSFQGRVFMRRQKDIGLDDTASHKTEYIESLFTQRVTDRVHVDLSAEQDKAARPDGRPTLIHGPAGCGKSIVITERVKRLVEERDYDPKLRILITTFNKALLQEMICDWLVNLLDKKLVTWQRQDAACQLATFRNSTRPNIYLLHFDVLPTRLGMVHRLPSEAQVIYGEQMVRLAEQALSIAAEALRKPEYHSTDLDRLRDPHFLLDEYHQVYYGLFQSTEHSFMTRPRPGRPRFNKNSRPRSALWHSLRKFRELLESGAGRHRNQQWTTFTERRLKFYEILGARTTSLQSATDKRSLGAYYANQLRENARKHSGGYPTVAGLAPWEYAKWFTHVFVDEMQDCTLKDYAIFYRLINNPNEIVVAGDLAQAVHLGRSASSVLPRIREMEQRNRRTHELQGSYRLPFRVSEAVVPLSERILKKREACNDSVEMSLHNPYRGSPPGARPIVVWAENENDMAKKIQAIYLTYGRSLDEVGFDLGICSILEQDGPLRRAVEARQLDAETNTVLRIKGLEKSCVIWSTRVFDDSEDDVEEYVYTILTRSAALLIIALFPDTNKSYYPVINTLHRADIVIWDDETDCKFDSYCVDRLLPAEIEEHSEPERQIRHDHPFKRNYIA
jgi:hypothetical protein